MAYIKHYFWVGIKLLIQAYCLIFRPYKKTVTVFLYHEISDKPSVFAKKYDLTVTPATFKKQVSWIRKNFNLIHPEDLMDKNKIPDFAAVITYDDAFLGAFENGISWLDSENIPSLMFLNMHSVKTGKPMLSAIALYLSENSREFAEFAKRKDLKKTYHLTLNPYYLDLFISEGGKIDLDAVNQYQGIVADKTLIEKFDNKKTLVYGNHLFEHWNSEALTDDQFTAQYLENAEEMLGLQNTINMFAFPNGQPGSCFSDRHIAALYSLKTDKIFYSSGGLNNETGAFLLNRTPLSEHEYNGREFWFRIFRSLYFVKQVSFIK